MVRIAPFLVVALIMAACGEAPAPDAAGVCWRANGTPGGKSVFAPLARGVDSLEDCAVLLEGARLEGGGDANGAYQGYFLFVDGQEISSASHAGGLHYPVFQPPQRVAVDRDLRRLMRDRGGKLPNAGDIVLDRQQ